MSPRRLGISKTVVSLAIILIAIDLGMFYLGLSISTRNTTVSTVTSVSITTSIQTSKTSLTVTSSRTVSTTVTSSLSQAITSTSYTTNTLNRTRSIPVGAYYYPWYGLPADTHWNNSACTATKDKPVQGYYDSFNSSLIRWQIQEAESAGLSFFIVSWWGPSQDNNTGDGQINYAVQNFFKVLSEMNTNFKAAIMIDADNSSLDYNGYLNVYNYIYSEFVLPYHSDYFFLDGKPLLTIFNTPNPESEHPPATNLFTLETLGSTPNPVDWPLWSAGNITHPLSGVDILQRQENFTPTIAQDGYVSVTPRFDDSLLYDSGCRTGALVLDQNLTLGLYQAQWNYVLGNRNNVSLVVVYSWNEYFERSFIEPAFSYTVPGQDPYYLLNTTSHYIQKLNQG